MYNEYYNEHMWDLFEGILKRQKLIDAKTGFQTPRVRPAVLRVIVQEGHYSSLNAADQLSSEWCQCSGGAYCALPHSP